MAVALRKESVDRNGLGICHYRDDVSSLSARRAWIEIACPLGPQAIYPVALRKESVDRNVRFSPILRGFSVALRKESVDRN